MIFIVGFCGRLFFAIFSSFVAGDEPEYKAIAHNLLHSGSFAIDPASPTSFRTPGYPLFTVACAGNARAVRVAQAMVDTLTVFGVYLLGTQLGSGRRGATWAAAIEVPLAVA